MTVSLKKKWIIIIVIILIAGFIFYQKLTVNPQSGKGKEYIIKYQNLKDVLSLSGTVDADEHTILRFQSSGKMTWVGVKEGDYVKKYQGIASLDRQELEKNLKKYLNTYMKSRWDFDQTKEDEQIKNIGGLSEDARREALRVLDKAQFDLDNAVIDVELKDIALKYAYLYTPIEGLVTRVDMPYAGVNITPAQAEFEIVNPKTIYFAATADQLDVVKVKEGLIGEVTFDAFPDLQLPGKIEMISFTPKSGETGTVYKIKIMINVDNSNYRYRFGMTGDANFTVSEKNHVLALPSSYIKTEKVLTAGKEGEKYVIKKIDGKNIKTYIKTGEEIDNNTIIIFGLKEGDIIYD